MNSKEKFVEIVSAVTSDDTVKEKYAEHLWELIEAVVPDRISA